MNSRFPTIPIAVVLCLGLLGLALIPGGTPKMAEVAAQPAALASVAAPDPQLLRMLDTEVAPAAQTSAETLAVVAHQPPPAVADVAPTETVADVSSAPVPSAATHADSIGPSAVNMRSGPASSAGTLTVLQPGQPVQVGVISGGWAQVTLADGSAGWVYSTYLASNAGAATAPTTTVASRAPVTRAVIRGDATDLTDRTAHIAARLPAYSRPLESSPSIFMLHPGDEVRIAEVRGDWLRVETDDGISGWIRRATD